MKYIALALSCLTLATRFAAAQAASPTKFCVIQAEAALVSTKDGQVGVAELQKQLDPKKTDLEKKQNALREKQENLQRQTNTISQTRRDELTREIDQLNKSFTREVEDYNAEAENAQRKVLDGLTERLKPVIDKYAKENGCAIVFNVSDPNTPVLYISDSIDITKEVVDLYDKTVSGKPATAPAKPVSAAPKPTSTAPAITPSAPKPAPAKP